MTDSQKQTLRRIYSIFLAVFTLAIGVLFIVQVRKIYLSKETEPYTVESVSAHFNEIAVWFYIWLAAIVVGGVLWQIFSQAEQKPKAYVELRATLNNLKRRLPQNEGGSVAMNGYARMRLIVRCTCATVLAFAAVITFVFMLWEGFPLQAKEGFFYEHKVAERVVHTLPWVIGALIVWAYVEVICHYMYIQEIATVKKRLAENAKQGVKLQPREKQPNVFERAKAKILYLFPFLNNKWWKIGLRAGVAAIGITFVIIGIFNGGMTDMLGKAINICTQCIGLG